MKLTEDGLALIRRFEGFRETAYRCPAGVWTIGYGHTEQAGPPKVVVGMKISEVEARRILAADADGVAAEVRAALTRELNDAQFSALVSFAFNVGAGAFRGSSVLAAANAGRFAEVPGRLKLWVKAGGRVLPGLEKRRAAEAALFMSAVEAPPPPARSGLMELLAALWRFLTARWEKR
jgi:lysozyme